MEKNIDLLKLKKKYYKGDIKYCYDFLDKLTEEIKKKSSAKKQNFFEKIGIAVFVDYKTGIEYNLNVTVINKILSYCYNEFFFNPLFIRNKKIREFYEVCCDYDSEFFDIFIKNLFSNAKERKIYPEKDYVYRDKEQFRYYSYWRTKKSLDHNEKSVELSKKLEKLDYIPIPMDSIEDIFPLSCNTFFFCNLFYSKSISYNREEQFHFLENILENFDNESSDSYFFSKNKKLDTCVQLMILISFKNLSYQRIDFDDNSFTKK